MPGSFAWDGAETPRFLGSVRGQRPVASSSGTAGEWLPHFWRRSAPPTHSERLERAGNPFCVAPWATCGDKYDGAYYVGGGAKSRKRSESRYWHEGTWGHDYTRPGVRTNLGWFHGTREQGGEGQYEPDEKNAPLGILPRRE